MGDHFEEALQKIARRSNGGGKSIDDVFDLTVAGNQDAEERHERLEKAFLVHCEAAGVRDREIGKLKRWQEGWEEGCPERLKKAVAEGVSAARALHAEDHARHMAADHPARRRDDPNDENHTAERDREHWLMWLIGSKIGGVIVQLAGGILLVLLTMHFTGK